MKIKIPNYLTIGRIIIVPVFVFTYYLPGFYGDVIPFVLFLLASFTDFLDGLLARMFKEESKLGELLDPIADKILVTFLILALSIELSSIFIGMAGGIMILREFWVGALRDFNARHGQVDATKVTFLAKIKTTIQLFTISIYLLGLVLNSMLVILFGDMFLFLFIREAINLGYIFLSV